MTKDAFVNSSGFFNNKLGISNNRSLMREELRSSLKRIEEIQNNPAVFRGDFSPEHLRKLHGHLFQDIYDVNDECHMAGKFRAIEIKGFAEVKDIENNYQNLAKEINADKRLATGSKQAAKGITELGYNFWETHGFRDGNTRTTQAVLVLLADKSGLKINLKNLHENSDFRETLVEISQIKQDEEYNKEHGLSSFNDPETTFFVLNSYVKKAIRFE